MTKHDDLKSETVDNNQPVADGRQADEHRDAFRVVVKSKIRAGRRPAQIQGE